MAQEQRVLLSPVVQPFYFMCTIEHWSIMKGEEAIPFPNFTISGPSKPIEWYVSVLPPSSDDAEEGPKYVKLHLDCIPDVNDVKVTVAMSFVIKSASQNDYVQDCEQVETFSMSVPTFRTCFIQLIDSEILEERSEDLVPNDVLTVIFKGKALVETEKVVEKPIEVSGSRLVEDIRRLLRSGADKDAKLVLANGKGRIRVNRSILCARSPVFAAMFGDKRRRRAVVDGFSLDVVLSMVGFIYTDHIPVRMTPELAMELTAAAVKYQLPLLESLCHTYLSKIMTPANVVGILGYAIRHGLTALKDMCVEFVRSNLLEVTRNPSWKQCCDTQVIQSVFSSLNLLITCAYQTGREH